MTKEEYNSQPVEFCNKATCCSLNIIEDEDGSVYCKDCGSTNIGKTDIATWEEYYIMAHGDKLLNKKRDDTAE